MTARGAGDDGSMSELPWASVFDPSVNVRALGEIQARGFRAASELVDRFVRVTTPKTASSEPVTATPAAAEPGAEAPKAAALPDVEQLLGTWKSMVGQLIGSIRPETTGTPDGGPATFDLVDDHASGEIAVVATKPGAVSTEVWVHNAGGLDLGEVRLRSSELMAHDGSVVESRMVRFQPDTMPMPARCSRGVTVQIDVADDVAPGVYRGTLMADGHPEVWMPVQLTVASRTQ